MSRVLRVQAVGEHGPLLHAVEFCGLSLTTNAKRTLLMPNDDGPEEKGKQTGMWSKEKGAEQDDLCAGKLDRHLTLPNLSIMQAHVGLRICLLTSFTERNFHADNRRADVLLSSVRGP